MKLLLETFEDVEYLTEGTGANKTYRIHGVFIQTERKNRNGRVYPKHIMEREVARYTRDYINERRALGELGHPAGPGINLPLVSHIIEDLKEDGTNYIGTAKILDTPNGRIVKSYIAEGIKIGVSSRALGSLSRRNGTDYVNEDLHLATAADIVADPSAPDAFVRGIMEGADWVRDETGDWVPQFAEDAKKQYNYVHKIDRKDFEVTLMEDFFKKLAKGE